MTTTISVWNPITIGESHREHRLAMAPITRDRSSALPILLIYTELSAWKRTSVAC